MKPVLDYLSTFLHLIGMLLFVGGHIWFGVFTAIAEPNNPLPSVADLLQQIVTNRLYQIIVLFLIFINVRRILFRYGDKVA
jgi:hypothetical protein